MIYHKKFMVIYVAYRKTYRLFLLTTKTIEMEIYFEDEQQSPLKKLQPKFYCDAVENNKVPCETQCYYCLKKEQLKP
jgi:hypothetical protein